MQKPKYKYSKKYIVKRVKSHKLLYNFLKESKLYSKYIETCHKCNTSLYHINRIDFRDKPDMAFDWGHSTMMNMLDGLTFCRKYLEYKQKTYEEI